VDKKDILDLNKKERRDDEGFLDLQRRTAVVGRTCALILLALLQLFAVTRPATANNNGFNIIIMGILGSESLAQYRITKRKAALIAGILCCAMGLFSLVQYLLMLSQLSTYG
jgi:hypothetical protein